MTDRPSSYQTYMSWLTLRRSSLTQADGRAPQPPLPARILEIRTSNFHPGELQAGNLDQNQPLL